MLPSLANHTSSRCNSELEFRTEAAGGAEDECQSPLPTASPCGSPVVDSYKHLKALQLTGRYHRLPRKLEDDYEVDSKVLDTGLNGPVYVAWSRASASQRPHTKYAMKRLRLTGANKVKRQRFEDEAEIFLSTDHPHVVRLIDVYDSKNELSLVMECLESGELFDRVAEAKLLRSRCSPYVLV